MRWYASATPSTVGTTTTFTLNAISSEFDADDDGTDIENAWARVDADSATSTTLVGTTRRISGYNTTTSVVTVKRAAHASNTYKTTHTIGLYQTVPPAQWAMQPGWKEYINRLLRGIRFRRWGLLTLVTDGDMETSGVANWTDSNATSSKVTAAANVAFGAQSLRVQNSLANGYTASASVQVTPNDGYELRADVRVASGTAHLVAWDDTNGAEIDSRNTTTTDWHHLYFGFTVPSGCTSVSIRLKGAEANADVYWDNISLRNQNAQRMALPSWIDTAEAFEGLVQYWSTHGDTNAYLLASQEHWPVIPSKVIGDPLGATQHWVEYTAPPRPGALLFVRGLSAYGELSAITDTTVAEQDLVVSGACLLAAIDLDDKKQIARFLPKWQQWAIRLPRRKMLLSQGFR